MKAKFDGNHLLSIENSLKIWSNIEICSKLLVSINFANLFPPLLILKDILLKFEPGFREVFVHEFSICISGGIYSYKDCT